MKELLEEFIDCFTWSYEEMPGLSHLVEHGLSSEGFGHLDNHLEVSMPTYWER
jgi:hypothetical protein